MIVSTSLIRRHEDISLDAFQRHWLDPHGPLTAKLPGTLRYDQNHVIPDAPGTNAVAQRMRVDGFPILAFVNAESRLAAHTSPEMAACNADSRHFIGAVSRVISDDGGNVRPEEAPPLVKQIFLVPSGRQRVDLPATLAALEGVCGSIQHTIIEQGGAPNSSVPFIGINVEAMAEVWISDTDAIRSNARWLDANALHLATFEVRVHRFI